MDVKKKKLTLNQETLRNLNDNDTRHFATVLSCRCSAGNSCGASQCTCPPPCN